MRQLSEFIGLYNVTRTIEDRRANVQSRFEGRVLLSMSPRGAVYLEIGALILDGKRFEAKRSYLWDEDGGHIFVRFADGRDFHNFDPVAGGLATTHLCGADMYRGSYDLSDWPRWSVTWEATGPRKNYQSVTTYIVAD